MVSDFNYWSKVGKRIFSLALTALLLYLVLKLSIFYMPFLIAFVLALLFEPIIRFLMKRLKWTRKNSSVLVMTIAIIFAVGIIGWGGITIFNESSKLLDGADGYFDKAKELITNITNNEVIMNKLPEDLKNSLQTSEADYIQSITNWIINTLNAIREWIVKIPNLLTTIFFAIGALYFMCIDKIYMIDQMEHHLPDTWSKKLTLHVQEITKRIGSYLKAEATLILISFIISLIGLTGFKLFGLNVKYPLLMAIGIGFVDALPILGSGTVMVPWAIIEALNGDIVLGVAIIILLSIMSIVRNTLEPKLVSKNIGVHPVFTLIAMFTGYKLVGIIGMIVGPVLLIIIKEVYTPLIDKGVFRAIFERGN